MGISFSLSWGNITATSIVQGALSWTSRSLFSIFSSTCPEASSCSVTPANATIFSTISSHLGKTHLSSAIIPSPTSSLVQQAAFSSIANVGQLAYQILRDPFSNIASTETPSWGSFFLGCGILGGLAAYAAPSRTPPPQQGFIVRQMEKLSNQAGTALPAMGAAVIGSALHQAAYQGTPSSWIGKLYCLGMGAFLSYNIATPIATHYLIPSIQSVAACAIASGLNELTQHIPVVGPVMPYISYPIAGICAYYGPTKTLQTALALKDSVKNWF